MRGRTTPVPHVSSGSITVPSGALSSKPRVSPVQQRRTKIEPRLSAPSPRCSKLELQPRPTSAKSMIFLPVIVDVEGARVKKIATGLGAISGMPVKTFGTGAATDMPIKSSHPGPRTTQQLVQLVFNVTGSQYLLLLRDDLQGGGVFSDLVQQAIDSRAPLVMLSGPKMSFLESTVLLDRDFFMLSDGTLDSRIWLAMSNLIII